MKKMLSLIMALAMVLALAVPAFAQQQQQQDNSTKSLTVAGSLMSVDIKVKAPTSASLILNPYSMKYTGNIDSLTNKQDQILSPYVVFENTTTAKLLVSGTFTPANAGLALVADAASVPATGDKKAFLQIDFGMMKNENGEFKDASTTKTYTFPATADGNSDGKKIELKQAASGSTNTAPNYDLYEIPETNGDTANYFGFQFKGKVTPAPTTVWASTDKIDVAVALKFTPKSLVGS